MDLTELLAALGLDPSADMAAILAAVADLKDKAAANPPPALNAYIPRADYDLLVNRVAAAEAQAKAIAETQHRKAVDVALNSALAAGKITPATADYYRGQCATPAGLAAFQAFAQSAPAVVNAGPDVSAKPSREALSLNAEQRRIAAALGLDEAAYLKTLLADQEAA